ncbi:hypothetical protein Bhyg_00791, partial [Pseudolycoriella hygida]
IRQFPVPFKGRTKDPLKKLILQSLQFNQKLLVFEKLLTQDHLLRLKKEPDRTDGTPHVACVRINIEG